MSTQTSITSELQKYQPLPVSCSLQDIRSVIPKHCFVRSARRSLTYFLRDLVMAAMLFLLVRKWDKLAEHIPGTVVVRWAGWAVYWWFQGLVFTGIWVLGHECGHGAFSPYPVLNDTLGYIIHSALWTPYFSWKISHHRHHTYHASMERDEVYVPKTRTDLGLPPVDHATALDYEEILGDTPLFTLFMLMRQQLLAFPAYLLLNVSGQQRYPRWTNHFLPSSVLFTREQRTAVLLSNLGLFMTVFAVRTAVQVYGAAAVLKYYAFPWLAVTHWFILITYLHHTDPLIPHFRGKAWTFTRGASATVDRPILGWQGDFFLHSVARYHVLHHFFPKIPFYHAREATHALRKCLSPQHYHFCDRPAFVVLWENYNQCQFVDDEGDVVFYRDRKGRLAGQA